MESKSADKKHSISHWLIVILTKIVSFLFVTPIAVCLFALGFVFSETALRSFLPNTLFDKIVLLLIKLPYFHSFRTTAISKLDLAGGIVWFTMMLGVPLMLIGFGLFSASFSNLIYCIFSPIQNKISCPFCKEK